MDGIFIPERDRSATARFRSANVKIVGRVQMKDIGPGRTVWITETGRDLAEWLADIDPRATRAWTVIILREPTKAREEVLRAHVARVVAAEERGLVWLPDEQLAEVLSAPNAEDLFVAGCLDRELEQLLLYRGSLEKLLIPLSSFKPTPGGAVPDPQRFSISDYGHGVRLGDYEAAADAILYEHDPEFRRRMKAAHLVGDPSFGSCLRRLRLLRGLGRRDFPGLSDKEVARIERGEVERPHRDTMEVLSRMLGVSPGEIQQY